MTNILVVEDRDSKYELLEGELKLMNVKFSRGRSIQEGMKIFITSIEPIDLLILDMQFPRYTNEKILANAGVIFIEEMKLRCKSRVRALKMPQIIGYSEFKFSEFYKGDLPKEFIGQGESCYGLLELINNNI